MKCPDRPRRRLVDAAVAIGLNRPHGDDLGFVDALFCSVTFPRSRIDGRVYESMSGRAHLRVEAGCVLVGERWVQVPLPFGPLPRLLMCWLVTQSLRRDTQKVCVGDSASAFLRALGKTPRGAQTNRGGLAALRQQIEALAVCRIQIGWYQNGRTRTENVQPVASIEVWTRRNDDLRSEWEPIVELTEDFRRRLQKHAVPIDIRALRALASSALAIDVYCWLIRRTAKLKAPVFIPWLALHRQFNAESAPVGRKNFKRQLKASLSRVLVVAPSLGVSVVRGGVRIVPSDASAARGRSCPQKAVGTKSYPNDIATPRSTTSSPRSAGAMYDIATPLKLIASSERDPDSSEPQSVGSYLPLERSGAR